MYIKNRLASIIYKADILALAVFGVISQFREYGWWALRLLAVIAGLMCIGYYAVILVKGLRDKEYSLVDATYPALKGTITISLALSGIMATAFGANLDLVDGMAILGLFVPILMLADWLFFDKKGNVKATAPFYFLALPIIYFSFIIVTSQQLATTVSLRYPYSFLDFKNGTIGEMLVAITINLVIVLTFGYAYFLADKLMCGEETVKERVNDTKEAQTEEKISVITEPERILPAGGEAVLPAQSEKETEKQPAQADKNSADDERDNHDNVDENDWDSDSYVIGEPILAESASEIKLRNTESLSAKAQEQQRLREKQDSKPATHQEKSTSKTPVKPSKPMDIVAPKKPKNTHQKPKKTTNSSGASQSQPRRSELRVGNLNRNGRARRNNNRRTPKFEDIMRVESKKENDSTHKTS